MRHCLAMDDYTAYLTHPPHVLSGHPRSICGESSARFYELRRGIEGAATPAALQSAEDEFAAAANELHDAERRRLRAFLSRRWKIIDQRRAAQSVERSSRRGNEEQRAR